MGLPWTPEEMMAVVMARLVRDRETVGVGALSPIPSAGVLLAQRLHAPNITLFILESPEHNPFPGGSSDFHFLAQRGELDLFFLSGVQIDARGNFNLHRLGGPGRPVRRFAGAFGSGLLYYVAKRVVLFRAEHTPRTLVPRVDFVSGSGETPEGMERWGGPSHLVTPLALFRFDREGVQWVLESVHPGHTVEEVLDRTGFRPEVPPEVPTTPPPTPEELRTLRTEVRKDLLRIYPDFARTALGPPEGGEG